MTRGRYAATAATALYLLLFAACGGGGGGGSRASTTTTSRSPAVGPPEPVFTAAGCTSDTRMDAYSDTGPGSVHTDNPGYKGPLRPLDNPHYTVDPPSGGDHLNGAVGPGVYAGANVAPDGHLMHSLEHGYVIIWIRPDLPAPDLQAVKKVFDDHRRDVLVVARASLTDPVAATAWGHRLLCPTVPSAALDTFVLTFANKGPEAVPH